MSARQMALLSDTHNCQVKEHNARIDLAAKLKQQILDAVDHTCVDELNDSMTGFAAVTAEQLLMHLVTRCYEIKRDDIKANKKKLAADWSPASTLEQLWIHARECQGFAKFATANFPEMLSHLVEPVDSPARRPRQPCCLCLHAVPNLGADL
jgi:hypothetical protein